MASSSLAGSSSRFGSTERTGGIGGVPTSLKTNTESESMAAEKGEQFLASDSFYQIMEAMINKEDVQSILDKQKETLAKFEKTNAKFGKFNELSASRFLHLNQQLKNYTKTLIDMKKDLDSIFRRIRTLKVKLAKQYGPAFHAISAGIQKLEEELGASIENEDTSSSKTLTESQEYSCESQTTDQQLKAVQQAIGHDAKVKEDISQVEVQGAKHGSSSEIRKSDDKSVESRTTTGLDNVVTEMKRVEIDEGCLKSEGSNVENMEEIKIYDTDSDSLRDTCASGVKESQDMIRMVDTDGMIRTVGTSDTIQTVDKIDTIGTLDTSDMTQRVDTSNTASDAQETSMDDVNHTVETSEITCTVHASEITQTVDTSEGMGGILDTSDVIGQ